MESEEIMDIDEVGAPSHELALIANGGTPSVSASVHPLVILNLSDQLSRFSTQNDDKQTPGIGALMGKQTGREVEIMDSFELLLVRGVCDGPLVISKEYYHVKIEQFKQVFSDMDCIGWYSTGVYHTPTLEDVRNQHVMSTIIENPILLKFHPCEEYQNQSITLYEATNKLENGIPDGILFVIVPHTIKTGEAERIGVNYLTSEVNNEGEENSSVANGLMTQVRAIKVLQSRAKLLLWYVRAVLNGEVPGNHQILREILSLTHRLNAMTKSSKIDAEYFIQCNDVAVIRLLSTLTKSCSNLGRLSTKLAMMEGCQLKRPSTKSIIVSIPLHMIKGPLLRDLLEQRRKNNVYLV